MTQEQDVVKAKQQIATLKEAYAQSICAYIDTTLKTGQEAMKAALQCQNLGNAYFNYAEEFVGNSDLLGAHDNEMWVQGFAEDCAELLRSVPEHFHFLRQAFSNIPELSSVPLSPGATAFANMQRMTVKYLHRDVVRDIRRKFELDQLPIYGFKHKAKQRMNKHLNTILAYVFGITFVGVILLIALQNPNPTDFQYQVFRTVLALSSGGIAAVIPGFIEVRMSTIVRAGGAVAVFVMIYFLNPGLRQSTEQAATTATSVVTSRNH